MLTKVFIPNKLATINIQNYIKENLEQSQNIEKIQDNMEGFLLIKYIDGKIHGYNYLLNKYYIHNKIRINFFHNYVIKQIESFDQNNWVVGNKIRNYVINKIKWISQYEFNINNILGIGGEYYLYWTCLTFIKKFIGITNSKSIWEDANYNIPWSNNYLINYNNLSEYPQIVSIDLIIINLSNINTNIIKFILKLHFKKIIVIVCDLPNSKLKLLSDNFIIKKIKYFKNFDGIIRIMDLYKKTRI